MALLVKNSKELIDPKNLLLKILLVAMPGFGKTSFLSTCPKVGIGVSETGHGRGLLSVAHYGLDYAEINSYEDFDSFCSGAIFKDKETLALDSLSHIAKTFIKDKALSIPRLKGESFKRNAGVPEIDDYGTMAEYTRKLTKKFIDQPKHIVCTATLKIDKPDPEALQTEILVGADFPGQMFLGSTAMFDLVLLGRTETRLRDPKDARTRYSARYWLTSERGGFLAKNRLSVAKLGSFLPQQLDYDLEANTGTFDDILTRAKEAYNKFLEEQRAKVQ